MAEQKSCPRVVNNDFGRSRSLDGVDGWCGELKDHWRIVVTRPGSHRRCTQATRYGLQGTRVSLVTRRVLTCGYRGVRVGEAVHPGLSRRVRKCSTGSQQVTTTLVHPRVQDTVQDSVTTCTKVTSRRRRRLRALPWSWSDTESDADPSEVVVSSNVPPEVLDAMERDLTMDPSVTQASSGLLPTWVDEASNPGPGDIRNARRMRSTQLDCES